MAAAATSAWLGAVLAWGLPVWIVVPLVLAAVAARRPVTMCLGLVLLTGLLADRAHAGLHAPPDAPFHGVVTMLTDPESTADGRLRFEADTERGRLLVEVRAASAAATLSARLAGDRARVAGATSAFAHPTEWTVSRHLAGRLVVESVAAVGEGSVPATIANRFRRMLDRGAASLPAGHRALLAGLVLGDDRAEPPQLTADFRAAGLTHLLAVSGENVAFVLVVVGPLLQRLRIWPRFVIAVGVVTAFALVTRFEPSVLRAAFVATVALFARTTGRPSGGVRHLCIAVCLLLAVDPLLVHSLGFRLSVAASSGVLVVSPRIADRLPGPRWFRDGLGVTAGAQFAVAPVLVPVLGPMPLAALPANVMAAPIAGALMVWGLAAGTVAGAVGGTIARLLHVPSGVGLGALESVAALGASLPLGHVDLRHLAVAGLAAGLVRLGSTWGRVCAATLVTAAVVAPVITPVPLGAHAAGYDATVWVDGPVAVVDVGPRASPVDVVSELRSVRATAVGLVVLRSGRSSAAAVLDAIESRFPVGAVIGPPGLDVPDLVVPPAGFRARVGRFEVVVDRPGPPMRVRVGWASADEVAVGPTGPAGTVPAVGSAGALGARPPPL